MVVLMNRSAAEYQPGDPAPAVPRRTGWAWAAYEPSTQRPWNLVQAGHLYRRAAFGAAWDELQQALSDGPQRTIDRLLSPQADVAAFNREHDEYETSAAGSVNELRAWWLRRMIQTPHPLLEKMTLFWHSHFATNAANVNDVRLVQRHVQLLRSQALGSFRTLLQDISRDPAMLLWLGADTNRKARPNENYARPLMDAFSLGPGNYTQKDVAEAARACTGWFVLRGQLRYIDREHDDGVKHILGQKGSFTCDDVVRIVLEQPAAAQTLVRKLYRFLISETEEPQTELIAPLAESFAKDYDILKLIETMLRSNLFFSEAAYHRRIKCPVEFALGIVRGLEGMVSTTQLAQDLADLGQNLYHLPTVNGWTGGLHWTNTATYAGRHNLALALLQGSGPYGGKLNPLLIARKHGASTPESAARFLLDLFLQGDPHGGMALDAGVYDAVLKTAPAIPARGPGGLATAQAPADSAGNDFEDRLRRFTHTVATLPEFNLT